jgi:hypothetical protein
MEHVIREQPYAEAATSHRRRRNESEVAGKKTIFPGDWLSLLLLSAILLMAGGVVEAQEEPKRGNLPDAPTQKREKTRLKTTLEILGKRSLFFPDLATDKGPLSSGKKLELAVDESIAPSRFLASSFTAGIAQARNGLPGYGQEWGGYGKSFGLPWPVARRATCLELSSCPRCFARIRVTL